MRWVYDGVEIVDVKYVEVGDCEGIILIFMWS